MKKYKFTRYFEDEVLRERPYIIPIAYERDILHHANILDFTLLFDMTLL